MTNLKTIKDCTAAAREVREAAMVRIKALQAEIQATRMDRDAELARINAVKEAIRERREGNAKAREANKAANAAKREASDKAKAAKYVEWLMKYKAKVEASRPMLTIAC